MRTSIAWLIEKFIAESNRIEGIMQQPTADEIVIAAQFLEKPSITIADMQEIVAVFQPDAILRLRVGLDVCVGNHIAPPGGKRITSDLQTILDRANDGVSAYTVHCDYETLHPFTDGNGRSGRMIWLWMMVRDTGQIPPLGFLHTFYYQSLGGYRRP